VTKLYKIKNMVMIMNGKIKHLTRQTYETLMTKITDEMD